MREGEECDVVGIAAVPVDVHPPGRLGHDGEALEGHSAKDETWNIDVTPRPRDEKVAAPERGVGVKVGHEDPRVKGPGSFRDRYGPPGHAVHSPLHDGGKESNEQRAGREHQGADPASSHQVNPIAVSRAPIDSHPTEVNDEERSAHP